MTHPLDQLAPFVDGTLDTAERAVVDEHLEQARVLAVEVFDGEGLALLVAQRAVAVGADLLGLAGEVGGQRDHRRRLGHRAELPPHDEALVDEVEREA